MSRTSHLALLLVLSLYARSLCSGQQPNILFIIIDDAGVDDVGYSANAPSPIRGKTPHIDALASEGVRLREYYTHPVCTPTRAALLSGRYAHNTGLVFPLLAHPIAGMPADTPLLPEALRDGGYATYMVGKWHIGSAKTSMLPLSRGFDEFYGLHGGGFDHYTKDGGNVVDLFDGYRQLTEAEIDVKEHATNLFSHKAIAMLRQHAQANKRKPFFMYLSYSAPHDPLQADPEYIQLCKEVPHPKRRAFCGMMAQLDHGVRNVTEALQELGLYDDTLIVFTSDNGGNPIVAGSNYPYTGSKSTAWEGGSRAPAFIKAPKRFNFVPRDFKGLTHVSDWMPTLLSLAGLPVPKKTDGHDLSRAFRSPSLTESPRTRAVIQHDVFLNSSAYRSGCHKLVLGCPGGNQRYIEPTERLLRVEPNAKRWYVQYLLRGVEVAFDLIELTTRPPLDQFFKYTLIINLARMVDLVEGTTFNHIINPLQLPLTVWHANLTRLPPVLDWTTNNGPRSLLFDICKDPEELHNLALDDEGRAIAERIFHEFLQDLADAPMQWAGDTILRGRKSNYAIAGPFLKEDVTFEEIAAMIDGRVFGYLAKAFEGLWKLTVLAFIVLVLAAIFLPRFLKKRQGGADGKKSNGGMQPVLRKSKSKKL